MRIAVLGPLEVDEGRVQLSPRDRLVLEALAARPGEIVRAEALAEALWGDELPPSWSKVVQGCVSRLRKALGPAAIVTTGPGYRLVLHRDDFDHLRFEDLLLRAGTLLAAGEPERARYASGEALGLWRGDPLERLTGWDAGRVESERLTERRRDAEELHAEATIRAGRHGEILADLQRLVAQQPTRERRWGLLALAQYRAGRQAEALGTLQRARTVLVNEFGLDPGPQLAQLEESILRQDPSLVTTTTPPTESPVCPYLGLAAYDLEDAEAFFGREADVVSCLSRLDEAGVLAVVGPSGSGKSSLVRAGVAAALVRDGNRVVVVTPGRHPEEALIRAPVDAGAVLVVDQFEEALAPDVATDEREAFFAGVVDRAARGRVVLSLRADRVGDLAAHVELARLVERGLYLLGGMGGAELRRAIEGPAAQAGLRLEPGLVDLLVREADGAAGALPLLSHVLRQTWRRREGDTLTVQGYAATGGVRDAVARSAERLYRGLSAAQQVMLRDLMVRLVAPDDTGEPIRTRVARRAVTPDEEHTEVVEALVGARLLSSDGDTVEIAHESLAVSWPRLRSWLDDDVDGLRIMRHLTVAAESWAELGRPDSELYRGVRQARAAEWHDRANVSLTSVERDFLSESAALAEKEQRATEARVRRERRSNQRLRAGLAAVAVLLAVAIVAGALATTAADRADRQAARAQAQALAADARRLSAEALRSDEIDRALLLAAAGVSLDDSPDTRRSLTQVLDRMPRLVGAARGTGLIAVSVRPEGGAIAAAAPYTGVRIIDPTSLEEVATNDQVPVRSVRFSPDGDVLAASVNPYTPWGERRVDPLPLQLLDATTAQRVPTQLGGMPAGRVLHESFGFSADGRWLAAGFIHPREEDGATAMRVWDTSNPARPAASFTVADIVQQLAVTPDGRRLLVTTRGGAHALDATTGREVDLPGPSSFLEGAVALAQSPDGAALAVVADGRLHLLDPLRLTPVAELTGEGDITAPLAFSHDGSRVAYTEADSLVVRSTSDRDAPPVRLVRAGGPAEIGFAADDSTLYAVGTGGLLLAWDLTGERGYVRSPVVAEPELAGDPQWSRPSPDGRSVAYLVTTSDGLASLQFLDVRTNTLSTPIATHQKPGYFAELAWRADSGAVAVAVDTDWVGVWTRDGGRLLSEHRVTDDGATTVDFGPTGDSLVIGTREGWVESVDGSGSLLGRVRVTTLPVVALSMRRDGLVAAQFGESVALADPRSPRVVRTADLGFVALALDWSPDAVTLAAGGPSSETGGAGVTALLDGTNLSVLRRTDDPEGGAVTLSFSADGDRFVTWWYGRVSLWDTRTGAVLGSLDSPDVMSAGFGEDSWTVVRATWAGTGSLWDARPATALDAACRIVSRDLTAAEWRTYLPGRTPEPVCT